MYEGRKRREKRLNVGVFVDPNGLNSESQEVALAKRNPALLVLEVCLVAPNQSPWPLRRAHDTEVLPDISAEQHANSAQNVIDIRVGKAESEEQECLGDEVSLQALDK